MDLKEIKKIIDSLSDSTAAVIIEEYVNELGKEVSTIINSGDHNDIVVDNIIRLLKIKGIYFKNV